MSRVRFNWNGKSARARAHYGAATGLNLAAEHLLGVSRSLVPIEEGTLERSGVASVDSSSLVGAVSYSTPYALRQHEELTWRHDPGRQAKYLETPLHTETTTMTHLVAAQIRRALR